MFHLVDSPFLSRPTIINIFVEAKICPWIKNQAAEQTWRQFIRKSEYASENIFTRL